MTDRTTYNALLALLFTIWKDERTTMDPEEKKVLYDLINWVYDSQHIRERQEGEEKQ